MSEQFIATAKVRIVPDIKGFQALLRTEVRKAIAAIGPQTVLVTPALTKGSAALIRKQVREAIAASGVHKIPVVPNTAAFQSQLKKELRTAQPVSVPVQPAPVGKAIRGGGAAASGQAAQGAIRQSAANTKLAASERELLRITKLRDSATAGTNKALATSTTLKEKDALLSRSLKQITTAEARAEITLRDAIASKNRELSRSVREQLKRISSEKILATQLAKDARLEYLLAEATKTSSAALAESTVLSKTASSLRKQDNALKAAEAELELALAEAKTQGVVAAQNQIKALEAEIAARRQLISTQLEGIKADKAGAASQATALRGARATGASLLNVRGATLAASDAFLAGAVAVAIFAKAVGSAVKLETELNVFRLTAGATAEEMERVAEVARQLGSDITLPAVSAGDAAAAMTNLAKAGLSVQDSVDGARGSLQLATAAQIENAEATELVASALNAFGKNGGEATHVADLLTGAANEAQGSISDMGIALQQSSAVARQAGLSLEDTVAFITLLARNGIRGSDAGTSLRTALLRLIAPTEDANKALESLGVTLLDQFGNIRPEVFDELQKALSRLEPTARNQTLRKIFGQDAIRAAVIFGREGAEGLNSVRVATNQFGLAAELAGARTAGLAGQIEALKNSLETLGGTVGGIVIPALSGMVSTVNTLIGTIQTLTGLVPGGESFLGTAFAITTDPTLALKRIGREVISLQQLADKGADIKFALPSSQLKSFRKELEQIAVDAKLLDEELRDIVAESKSAKGILRGDLLGVNQSEVTVLVEGIRQMKSEITGTSGEAEKARLQLEAIERLVVGLGRQPTRVELEAFIRPPALEGVSTDIQRFLNRHPPEVKIGLEPKSLVFLKEESAKTGSEAAQSIVAAFGNILTADTMEEIFGTFLSGIPKAVNDATTKAAPVRGLSAEELQARIAGFDAQRVRAELRGNTADIVAVLLAEQTFLEQQLRTPKAQRQPFIKRLIESQLLDIADTLEGFAEDKKQKSEEAADKIKDAREKADDAVIKAFSRTEEDQETKILIAESTETLRDDIRRNQELRRILRDQIKAAAERIKDLEKRRDFVRATRKKVVQLALEIKADQKAFAQELIDQEQERREEIRESISLKIEFFEITENEKAEIQARQRLINNLQKEINAIKRQGKLTREKRNRIQQLKNEQARERAAIKELREEKEKSNDEMKKLFFSFLQAQQGFAANLLGNLIPANVTGLSSNRPTVSGPSGTGGGSLVTGVDPLTGRPLRESGGDLFRGAGVTGGPKPPSSGQLSELIEINRGILRMLARIAGDAKHPEAKRSRISNRTALDLHGPGV